ncbi:MAG: hypothetical protein V8S24_11985 [Gordonibacter pamelaeae]
MTAPAWAPAAPVLVITGHYGVGKTNLALNLALDAAARGLEVTVVDLDVVNPFFRSSDYRALLDEAGARGRSRPCSPARTWTGRACRAPSCRPSSRRARGRGACSSWTRAATTWAPRRSGASRARWRPGPTRCSTW